MNLERQRQIEQRAYALWEAEGQPQGRHEEHWHRAMREIDAEESTSRTKKRAGRRAFNDDRSPKRKKKATA